MATVSLVVAPLCAQTNPALEFSSAAVGTSGIAASAGWEFTVNSPITVTALDAFEGVDPGNVRLYDSTGTTIASAIITTSSPTEGLPVSFYTQSIAPTLLNPGTYFVAEDWEEDTTVDVEAGGLVVNPDITYVGAVDVYPGTGLNPLTDQNGGIFEPGYFGPDFDIQSPAGTPEPGAITYLVGAGCFAMVVALRRRRLAVPGLGIVAILCTMLSSVTLRAQEVYSTQDTVAIINGNPEVEVVPNGPDGTAGRPAGDAMGNTIIFAGSSRYVTSVQMPWGTIGNAPLQTITLSLYLANGAPDLSGPGINGPQPGALIAQSTTNISAISNGSGFENDMLNFQFSVQVPTEVVAIVRSDFLSTVGGSLTGPLASTDFTPAVGSNPFGDELWFGSGSGTFASNNTWVDADAGGSGLWSNNLAMVVNAQSSPPEVPEPGPIAIVGATGIAALAAICRNLRLAIRT